MKKILLLLSILVISLKSLGQTPLQQVNFGNNTPLNRSEWYRPNSPTNTVGNREVVGWIAAYDAFVMQMDTIRFTKLHSAINNGLPNGIIWTDNKGNFKRSPISEIKLPYAQITSPPFIPQNKADIGLNNAENTSDANKPVSIAQQLALDQKVNNNRTITINGTAYDLSVNRSWNVGDVNTSNSYPNPSWIPSFDYNKLTNKPLLATVAISGDYNDLSNKPPVLNRVFGSTTFSGMTTATQISLTRDSWVTYDVDGSISIVLLAGQSVTGVLQYADNAAMTTNVVTLSAQTMSNSGVVGLAQGNTLKFLGIIPAGKYRKVTFTGTGSPTLPSVLKANQEVQL